jgi:hypothetical protein
MRKQILTFSADGGRGMLFLCGGKMEVPGPQNTIGRH